MRSIRVLFLLSTIVGATAFAQSGGGSFEMTKSAVAPATVLSGGPFAMVGTVGQPTASGIGAGAYQLTSGFAATSVADRIFANGFGP